MNLLPALVVGLTAGLLAVQDCKDEKWTKEKEPERTVAYSVETPLPISDEEAEEYNKMKETYEQIVKDEYLLFPMEEDISEEIGDEPEEEEPVAEGESIREITEDEFEDGVFNFERIGLMYFTEDRVLCDGDMVTIDNPDEWLGTVDLEPSDEIIVKWIRNFDLSYDIRLEIIEDSYSGSC